MANVIKKVKVGETTYPVDRVYNLLSGINTVEGNANSGQYLSVRWYVSDVEGITAPYNGMKIAIKVPLAGVGTAGAMLSINGNTDSEFHPLAYNVNTVLTTYFPVNSIKIFTYDANQSMTCYKTKNTSSSVTGVWKADSNYDSNTTLTYGNLAYYFRAYTAQAVYRYKFVMLDKDNRLVPLTTTNVANGTAVTNQTPTALSFRPDKIYWYNSTTTISAGGAIGGNTLVENYGNANNTTNGGMAICNFNSTISAYRMIYLCGTYDKTTGLFTLRGGGTASSTQYYTQVPNNTANINLATYFTTGYDYILLGGSYSSNNYVYLRVDHPMFHFDGTNLVPYDTWNDTNAIQKSSTAGLVKNDGTIDTTSYYPSSNPNGYTSNVGTVTKVNNTSPDASGNVTITIPTPDYPVTDVKIGNTSIVSSKVATLQTNSTYNASTNKIATMSDLPTVPTTYLKSASTNGNTLTIAPASGSNVVFTPTFTEQHIGDVISVGATSGSNIAIGGTTANPTVGVASGYSIPSTTKQSEWDAKGTYSKPSGGIPSTDLADTYVTTNTTQTITGAKTFSGNPLTLYSASGDSPMLIFQRGTLTDTYNDWGIVDSGGFLYFKQRGSSSTSWADNRVIMAQSYTDIKGEIYENGTSLKNKYQAKLPTYDSSKANYLLSIDSSGNLVWKAPYDGSASGS